MAEYNGAGTLQRRYVHGLGVDEPLVWYEGTGTTAKKWLYADHLGSVVATADAAGTSTNILTYGPFGEMAQSAPDAQRFGYTGQQQLKGLGLFHYKARVYSPALGRFLQTDPIGIADDLNLYGYVGNSPLNATDPEGLCPNCVGFAIGVGLEVARQAVTGEMRSGAFLSNFGKASAAGLAGAAGIGIGRGVASLTSSIGYRALANGVGGAGVGAANQVVNNGIDGKNLSGGVGRAATFGAGGAAFGSVVGDKIDTAASASAAMLKVAIGKTGNFNLAHGIRDTTKSSYINAPVGVSGGERAGALAGGIPSFGDYITQSLK